MNRSAIIILMGFVVFYGWSATDGKRPCRLRPTQVREYLETIDDEEFDDLVGPMLLASEMTPEDEINLRNDLFTLGWVSPAPGATADDKLATALSDYADFWAIEPEVNAVRDHISQRSCMVPDNLAIEDAKWPENCQGDLGLFIDWGGFNENTVGFSQVEAEELFASALNDWNQIIAVRLYVSHVFETAKTNVQWTRLSGPTLAWSHLANNSCADDKQQRYDLREWSKHQFYLTVLHEVGHLLGLPHRRGSYVMNPSILTSLAGLTERDIQDARNLGYASGPLAPNPIEPEPPAGTPSIFGTITLIDGTVFDASKIKRVDITVKTSDGPGTGGPIVLPPLRRKSHTGHSHKDGECLTLAT